MPSRTLPESLCFSPHPNSSLRHQNGSQRRKKKELPKSLSRSWPKQTVEFISIAGLPENQRGTGAAFQLTISRTTHHRDFEILSKLSLTKQGKHYRSDPVRVQSTPLETASRYPMFFPSSRSSGKLCHLGPIKLLGRGPIKNCDCYPWDGVDGNWSSFQLAKSTPPQSVIDCAIAPSARMPTRDLPESLSFSLHSNHSLRLQNAAIRRYQRPQRYVLKAF